MKKLIFITALILSVGLAACGTEEKTEVEGNNASKVEETAKKDTAKEETSKEEVTDTELGKFTVHYKNKEININKSTGPMNLSVKGVQLATLEVSENYKELFDNQDVVTVVTLNMIAENTSDDNISFYPDQGTIVTDTGQQVEADIFLSGEVGGDFLGKVKKEDDVIWIFKKDDNIKNLTLHVDGPSDENFETIGDRLEIEIPIQ